MITVCKENQCTGCMACLEMCAHNAIEIKTTLRNYNAVIDTSRCIECGACHRVCHNNMLVAAVKPIKWFQGWTYDEEQRMSSSSGGLATALAKHFVNKGGIVCSCIFSDGEFCFGFAEKELEVEKFTGSKYVQSNPKGIYKRIRKYLTENREVLFIGLPCQTAAVKTFVGDKYSNRLYLVDLICHGSPSYINFKRFLRDAGYDLTKVLDVEFRKKSVVQKIQNECYVDVPGVYDCYSLAFLNCINFTENCYSCHYAKRERVSDITLGDSWGSDLPKEEQNKGISLVLCQTEKGQLLLQEAAVELRPVDMECAIEHNHQLERPSIKPNVYNDFFEALQKGKSYYEATKIAIPRTYRNQQIKKILMKLKILRRNNIKNNRYAVTLKLDNMNGVD